MSENRDILDRLDLLEQRYLVTRERLSKLERVQYQIRDQIGFIQFLSKDPSSQKPIEDRLTEIYGALGEILDQIDGVQSAASASQFVPAPQPAIPAQAPNQSQSVAAMHKVAPVNPMHQTHAPHASQQVPVVRPQMPAANPMHQTHAPHASQQAPVARPQMPAANPMHQTHAPQASQAMPAVQQQAQVHPPINYKPRASQPVIIKR